MANQRERDRFDGYAVELFLDEDNDCLAHLVELPGSRRLVHPLKRRSKNSM
jgi:hypothetical protein